MDNIDRQVLKHMVAYSQPQGDGSGRFNGSPRPFMERFGVSSGHRYKLLYNLGLERHGRGNNATWYLPPDIMSQYSNN